MNSLRKKSGNLFPSVEVMIVREACIFADSSSRALKGAKECDGESTRTIGVIGKIDQVASDQKALAVVQTLLNSLETAWNAESESLKSILTGAP
ncbi:unnamed protein product [Linum tenue]|uniref:Uncharacterized protein n=1 Tax=Linum tenue TaxID=586396 RepID=A0AAV0MPC3_9ROSI|nr:unnamed protein product [Linum tenue]